jgi:hypothetical protein
LPPWSGGRSLNAVPCHLFPIQRNMIGRLSSALHISEMTQNSRTNLLEVVVTKSSEQSWEWKVMAGEEILVVGFEPTRLGASVAGNDALFLALTSGWNV